MLLSISLRDGALGYSASSARGLAFIGVSTTGTVGQLVAVTDPKSAADIFGTGKLVDRIAYHFANSGPGPVYAMRATSANAGSMPSYRLSLHAAHREDGADIFPSIVAATQTWLANNPRNIEIDFLAGWQGGDITVVGTDVAGNAITEIIADSAGNTVKGNRVFKTITSITKELTAGATDTAAVFTGNKSAEGASTTDGQLASTGSVPLDDYELRIVVTRAGSNTTAAFKYSLDDGETYSAEIAMVASYTGLATSHGLTLVFSGSAFKVGDEFRFGATGPTMDSTALSNALTALHADASQWEGLHILGALTGAQAATVETWHGTCRAAGRFAWTIAEARDFTGAEAASTTGNATWQTSVKADYASVLSTYGQLAVVAGYIETVVPAKGIYRRSAAWAVATQISRLPLSEHPGQPIAAGPLRGVFKPAGGVGLYQDERVNPGMGGSLGRFLTVQTLIGKPNNFFVGDDAGLRSPGTMASGSSDYSLHMNVRVILEACRRMQEKGTDLLARRVATKQNGTLLESEAKKLDDEVSAYLRTYMVEPGHCVTAYAVVSRSHNVLSTKQLPFQVFVRPFGYALNVVLSIGFEKVLV